jgi:xylitol oxidase
MTTSGVPHTNWAGNIAFSAARVRRPESIDELRRIVRTSGQVRALGSGHSFSPIADSPGDLVLLDALPRRADIDPGRSELTVTAGLSYSEVAVGLDRAGLALANLASLPHISVAGSCATGTHGSGDTQRCLAASVTALRMVAADGELIELRSDTGSGSFAGSVVALGALGIVTHVTLAVEPAFEVAQSVYLDIPLDEISGRFGQVFGAAYSVSAFTTWRSGMASVFLKCRTDQPEPRWTGGRPAPSPVNPVPELSAESCTEQMGIPGPWHERLPHFRPDFMPSSSGEELQSEFFLPREAAPAAFAALRDVSAVVAPVLQISEVRTVRGDDLWLSPACGRDSVTFHFTWVKDDAAIRPAMAAVEERLMPLGARPHWGKITSACPAEIIASYPRRSDFERLMAQYDPAGKFRNSFLNGLFPPG